MKSTRDLKSGDCRVAGNRHQVESSTCGSTSLNYATLSISPPSFVMFKSILPGTSKRISNSEFMMVTPLLDPEVSDLAAGRDKENIEFCAPKMVPTKSAPVGKLHKRTFSQAAPKEDPNAAFEQLLVSVLEPPLLSWAFFLSSPVG